MGERKVLNRYFPPDFDPSLVPKRKWDPLKQVEVRMMIPFSMQCLKCGEFMYRGKKFNSRKEDALNEDYLGVRIYRFYVKCSVCSNEIAFKTDPKNQDYVCESGASRNYESWRQQDDAEASLEASRKADESQNAMAALEGRTLDSKIEMDILDALDEIKAHNRRTAELDTADVLRNKTAAKDDALDADQQRELDEFLQLTAAKHKEPHTADPFSLVGGGGAKKPTTTAAPPRTSSRAPHPPPPPAMIAAASSRRDDDEKKKKRTAPPVAKLVAKRKRVVVVEDVVCAPPPPPAEEPVEKPPSEVAAPPPRPSDDEDNARDENALAGLLGGYGSSSGDEQS